MIRAFLGDTKCNGVAMKYLSWGMEVFFNFDTLPYSSEIYLVLRNLLDII